jgi:hopanoid biosynthesis associated protein HpnK
MQAPRLIVHADDFGLSRSVNEGILEAHSRGILTSASVMASGEAFDYAIQLVRSTPSLDVGVHLTLTEERPVLGRADIPTLLNDQGLFHANPGVFLQRYLSQRISLDDVRCEFDAQIGRVAEQGVRVSHLDGHQHLHMVPGIRRVVGELAKKYAIPAIRFPRERLQGYMFRDVENWSRLLQQCVLNCVCSIAAIPGAMQPDHFVGFAFGGKLIKENLFRVLQYLPETGTCELMCHPGHRDPQSHHAHWGYRWQEELEALTDPEIRQFIESKGIRLVSYAALANS